MNTWDDYLDLGLESAIRGGAPGTSSPSAPVQRVGETDADGEEAPGARQGLFIINSKGYAVFALRIRVLLGILVSSGLSKGMDFLFAFGWAVFFWGKRGYAIDQGIS